ncbi:MAG: SbcC/MukB-like Walker B domain-containing protein, partial [Nakamurella sp.]
DTGRFGTIEGWFAESRRVSASALRERMDAVDRLVARTVQASGWRGDLSEEPDAGWLDGVRDLVDARRAWTAEVCAAAATERRWAADASRTAAADAARRRRVGALRRLQREVVLTEPDRRRWRDQIERAHRAAPVVDAGATCQRAEGVNTAAKAERDRRVTQVLAAAAPAERDLVPDDRSALVATGAARAAGAAVRDRAGHLGGLIAQSREQDADFARLSRLRREVVSTTTQRDAVIAEAAELPIRIDVLTDRHAHGQADLVRLPELRERATALALTLADCRRLPAAVAARQRAVDEAQRAVDDAQAASTHRLELTARRIDGMAAELARRLAEFVDCPVCGAVEHPRPAVGSGDAVSREAVAAAHEAEDAAICRRDTSVTARAAAEHAVAVLEATLAGRTVDELEAASAGAAGLLREATASAAEVTDLGRELRDLRSRADGLATRAGELATVLSELSARIPPLAEATARRAEVLTDAAADYPDVLTRRTGLLELADRLDALDTAIHVVRAAREGVTTAWADVTLALAASGFPDLDAARAAVSEDLAGTEERLLAADRTARTVEAQLADPDLADVAGDDPDLDVVARELRSAELRQHAAEEAATTAFADARAAAARQRDVAELAAELTATWTAIAPVRAADRRLSELTDVLLGRGANRLGMSLRSYVLAAWLHEVAVAANHRLRVLSGGRYTFVPSTARESRGRSGGLGLDVLDEYSGKTRPTKTLSGGESFLASLALALGLADVVAGQTGVGLLNTMFIDEGFGTLDADSLDLVMETLDSLRGEGRVIGVVSHVDELRQRIPSRLRVRRAADGSTVELCTPAAPARTGWSA